MNYRNISVEVWNQIDKTGDSVSGYKSMVLGDINGRSFPLHLFIDEKGAFHFAIEAADNNVEDPNVNGLTINIRGYQIRNKDVKQTIDLCCNIHGYLEEFTGVIKEIAECIIEKNERPAEAVNRIVRNWKVFWANQNRQMLSEEEILGLICELQILHRLCGINMANALSSWSGPQLGKTDFNFTSWELEVKATRNSQIVHTINGLEQLRPSANKSLAFISFLVTVTDNESAISLPVLIDQITNEYFSARADLAIRFNELLAEAGYNPVFAEQYQNFKIEILQSTFYIVDENFPKLTFDNLNVPLSNRISKVRYNISLEGISCENLSDINWGNYFY